MVYCVTVNTLYMGDGLPYPSYSLDNTGNKSKHPALYLTFSVINRLIYLCHVGLCGGNNRVFTLLQ